MDSNNEVLKIVAQGVINSLFAKRLIPFAPTVIKVVEERSYHFRIHLDHSGMSLIRVAVEPKEYFAEVVRKAVLKRLCILSRDHGHV